MQAELIENKRADKTYYHDRSLNQITGKRLVTHKLRNQFRNRLLIDCRQFVVANLTAHWN